MIEFLDTVFATPAAKEGTNGAALFQFLMECCPDIEVIEFGTMTETNFVVNFRFMGDHDMAYRFSSSSSGCSLYMFVKDLNGTTIIAGETYSQVKNCEVFKYGLSSDNTLINVHVIRDAGKCAILHFAYSYYNMYFTALKCVDMCSGDIVIVSNCSTHSTSISSNKLNVSFSGYRCINGTYASLSVYYLYNIGSDNGFTRMHPVQVYGNGFLGQPLNPTMVYYTVCGGDGVFIPAFTDFSVGGVRFLSIGYYAIRLS